MIIEGNGDGGETYNFKSVRGENRKIDGTLPHIGKLVRIECNLMN